MYDQWMKFKIVSNTHKTTFSPGVTREKIVSEKQLLSVAHCFKDNTLTGIFTGGWDSGSVLQGRCFPLTPTFLQAYLYIKRVVAMFYPGHSPFVIIFLEIDIHSFFHK